MTLAELTNETLTQKHRRLMQQKCRHAEIYSSTVASPAGTFTASFCLDCGKRLAVSRAESTPPVQSTPQENADG